MSVTINSSSTPSLAAFQADISDVVEILKRGGPIASLVAPGTITHLANLCNTANGTTSIVLS